MSRRTWISVSAVSLIAIATASCGGDSDDDRGTVGAASCESACADLVAVCSDDWFSQSECVEQCEEDSQGRDAVCPVPLYDCLGSLTICDIESCGTVTDCPEEGD